jgi:hypothetical protein
MKTKNSFFYDFIILILIFNISQASVLNSRFVPFALGVILIVINFFKNKKYNRSFITLTAIWLGINLLAAVLLTGNIPILRIIIDTVNLLFLPYLLLSLIGMRFWKRFESIVYLLTLISLPLYALNIIFLDFFNSLWPFFRAITSESFGEIYPYWTSFFYVNAIGDPSNTLMRSSGFMWEPGGFAMIIIWAIIYNLRNNGNKFDKKIIVYIIALITTFSTAGYLAIIFIVMSVYLKRLTLPNLIVISVLMVFYFTYVYKLGFMSEKINSYIVGYQDNELIYDKEGGYIKVNRLRGAYYDFQETLKFPIGYGVINKSDISATKVIIYGTNGLGSLLVMWGFPIFIYLMVLIRRYINVIGPDKIKLIPSNLLLTSLLIIFFSNPISHNVLIYLIFFTPLVMGKIKPTAYNSNGSQIARQPV